MKFRCFHFSVARQVDAKMFQEASMNIPGVAFYQ